MTINYSNDNYTLDVNFHTDGNSKYYNELKLKVRNKNDELIFKCSYNADYFSNAMCLTYLSLIGENHKITDIIEREIYDEREYMLIDYSHNKTDGWAVNIYSMSVNQMSTYILLRTEDDCKFIIQSLKHAIYSQYSKDINDLKDEYNKVFNSNEEFNEN